MYRQTSDPGQNRYHVLHTAPLCLDPRRVLDALPMLAHHGREPSAPFTLAGL